ncbi:MAG: GNAT family N-acetyltransferase [Nitrosomonas sp.]|nr:GNAT family N-acetyltransferase [Nitrosomonas sp.]MDP1952015.1 GNAT family N-acetyltransferase [Nitrosomonas sp.]
MTSLSKKQKKHSATVLINQLLQTAHQRAGDLQSTQQVCKQVLKSCPNQPDALHLLGITYAQLEKFEEANYSFERAISILPERADFYANYANALWKQGNINKGIDFCRQAILLDEHRPEFHNILGCILLSGAQFSNAEVHFRKALTIRPNYLQALNNLGNALQKQNKTKEAVAAYQHVISLQPDYADAFYNLGLVLKNQGNIYESANCFTQVLTLCPDFFKASQALKEVSPTWLLPLEGNRLLLRPCTEKDAVFLHTCYRNSDFMAMYNKYIPRNLSMEELVNKLRQSAKNHPCQTHSVNWVIIEKNTGRAIGIAALTEINFQHQRAEFLLGIPCIADRKSGAALEAALLILNFAFNQVDLHKITSVVYGDNEVAQKNILALGFIAEGCQREHLCDPEKGHFFDVYVYGMTRSDFYSNIRLTKLARRFSVGVNIHFA